MAASRKTQDSPLKTPCPLDVSAYPADTCRSVDLQAMSLKALPTIDHLAEPLRRFMDRMTAEQRMLLVLKRELYDGAWQPMIADLENRLAGRPYVLKLANRIEDDLKRIEQMQQMEEHYEVDLAAYIEPLKVQETPE